MTRVLNRIPHTPRGRHRLALRPEQTGGRAGSAKIAGQSGLELVVLRPPLVYGPGAPGRFALLPRLLRGGWPLPLAGLPARRSVIFIDNLLDAIELALEHPAAAGRCFALCDAPAPFHGRVGPGHGRRAA